MRFAHPLGLYLLGIGLRVKFVYEGHQIKTKVTGATKINM